MTKAPQDQITADLMSALSASRSLVAQINTLSEDNANLKLENALLQAKIKRLRAKEVK